MPLLLTPVTIDMILGIPYPAPLRTPGRGQDTTATTMKPAGNKTKAFLKARHVSVREAMKHLGIDALLLTHAPDVAYLTDFTGDDSFGILTDKELHLITDFRYREQAELECGWTKITVREGRMSEALAQTLTRIAPRKIGFDADHTTVGQIDALAKALSKGGKMPELLPVENVLANIRRVKDDNELDLIRKSIGIAEEAFEAVRGDIKPGLSENYIAGLLISELRSRGASDYSFPPIVATGAHTSLPHYRPDEALIQKDQPLLIDWGGLYRGYCSDLTRMIMFGRISPKIKEIHKVVLDAQLQAIAFLRPGVTTRQADTIARTVIEKAGYGQYFGHGLGHGIGREIHEAPALRKTEPEDELRPGMVVTVEPGIYIKGEGGVRIEDDVLITHSGCEVLSTLPKTFEACHIE